MTAARIPTKADAAIALKLAGASNADIAQALGFPSERAVQTAVEKGLAGQLSDEDRSQARALQLSRYERLLRSAWQHANDGNDPQQLPFLRASGELIDKIVRLEGLAQPAEIIVHSPALAEISQWVERRMKESSPGVVEADILDERLEIEGPDVDPQNI